jgi:DNA-binding CsgD family transcriptional regulator
MPNQHDTAIQLTVPESYFEKTDRILINKIRPISSWIRITRLNIDCSRVSIPTFIKLLNLLSHVDSVRLSPMDTRQIHHLTETEVEVLHLGTTNNNITKISIGLITEITQATFFVDLFPDMKYLEVYCANDIDLETLIQDIFIKINVDLSPLFSLCLCFGKTNDRIVEKLDESIKTKGLLLDYTIARVDDRIHLQWK